MSLASKTIDSPVGRLKLVASEKALVAILWENDDPKRVRLGELVGSETNPVLVQTERQLAEYFAGKRRSFTVPLDLRGTPFQRDVWESLLAIPFGETRRYGELARQLGKPQAARAVGAATGKNPVSIVVPCHRVIGAGGELTGFAGGLDAKRSLLVLEQTRPGRSSAGHAQEPIHGAASGRRTR
ncbi:MAG: methylated-DNA--[protein]-cysteine S-methyltransferase [Acidobacteriaceae bacterium]